MAATARLKLSALQEQRIKDHIPWKENIHLAVCQSGPRRISVHHHNWRWTNPGNHLSKFNPSTNGWVSQRDTIQGIYPEAGRLRVQYRRTFYTERRDDPVPRKTQKLMWESLGRWLQDRGWSPDQIDQAYERAWDCIASLDVPDCGEDEFQILEGDELMRAYRDEWGGHSCMTLPDRQQYIEMYGLNPDKVKLAVFGIKSRALVWTPEPGVYLVDRVYPEGSDFPSSMFISYLRAHVPEGSLVGRCTSVDKPYPTKMKLPESGMMPYGDHYTFSDRQTRSVVVDPTGKQGIDMHCTEGGLDMDTCEDCGDCIHTDDVRLVDASNRCVCQDCFDRYYTYVESLQEYFSDDDVCQNPDGEYILIEGASRIEWGPATGKFIEDEEIDDSVTIDGETYHICNRYSDTDYETFGRYVASNHDSLETV